MTRYALLTLLFSLLLTQLPGCHFYVRAVPNIIVSSEPFAVHERTTNSTPPKKTPETTPRDDRPSTR